MSYSEYLKIGLNHHLLYSGKADEPKDHERTLRILLEQERLDILDCWVPENEPFRSSTIKALKESGKEIYYNVGSRKGKKSAHPATLDPDMKKYSLDFYKNEIDRAIEAGAVKIITNSGVDVPENRAAAFDCLVEFYCEICRYVPADTLILIEPTDRDTDKKKCIGPSREAVALAKKIHAEGCRNFASMVDMGHLPLMGETIEQAMKETEGYIGHMHLGNCILKDRSHPLWGDKHVAWGIEGGEYGLDDLAHILSLGLSMDYFNSDKRSSASFEMRPFPGKSPEESLDTFFIMLERSWEKAFSSAAKGGSV